MTHLSRATLLLAALFVSGVAVAGGESGFYIGAGVGNATTEVSTSDPTGGADFKFDGDDSGYKIIAGFNLGLVPLIDLAVEGSYVDFGKVKGTSASRDADTAISGWDAFGLAGMTFGPIGIYAKAGFINWDSEGNLGGATKDQSGTDGAYGVGARFQLFSVTLRAEYEEFQAEGTDKLSLFSLSALYTF